MQWRHFRDLLAILAVGFFIGAGFVLVVLKEGGFQ
jgi:hypothetical protein